MELKEKQTNIMAFNKEPEKIDDNIIRIAGKDEPIYNQVILNKLQKFDEIVISVNDAYIDRADLIIRKWEAVGLLPVDKVYHYIQKEEEVGEGKQKRTVIVNTMKLRKHHELFKFTKPE